MLGFEMAVNSSNVNSEYLTGFSKRKQERRRFGLDMEAYKQQKRLMEARKQRREEQKQQIAHLNIHDDEAEEKQVEAEKKAARQRAKAKKENGNETMTTNVLHFDDEHTQSKFGNVVTVTTSIGDLPSDSDDHLSDLDDSEEEAELRAAQEKLKREKQSKDAHLTMFQRIQLKRRGIALPTKRSKIKNAREASKGLLKKAGKKINQSGKKGKQNTKENKDDSKKKMLTKRRKH